MKIRLRATAKCHARAGFREAATDCPPYAAGSADNERHPPGKIEQKMAVMIAYQPSLHCGS